MWISRDKTELINITVNKPVLNLDGMYYAVGSISCYRAKTFKKPFPNAKLPRKSSCREIAGLKIIEVKNGK